MAPAYASTRRSARCGWSTRGTTAAAAASTSRLATTERAAAALRAAARRRAGGHGSGAGGGEPRARTLLHWWSGWARDGPCAPCVRARLAGRARRAGLASVCSRSLGLMLPFDVVLSPVVFGLSIAWCCVRVACLPLLCRPLCKLTSLPTSYCRPVSASLLASLPTMPCNQRPGLDTGSVGICTRTRPMRCVATHVHVGAGQAAW